MKDQHIKEKVLVIIPARLNSMRFPKKILADINGLPMILHTAIRARKANIGRVIVAVDDTKINEIVLQAGFESVMTHTSHQSGSDRIFEALNIIDSDKKSQIIVNMQADIPNIEPEILASVLLPLQNPIVDIGTLGTRIHGSTDPDDPNIVKIVVASPSENGCFRALYFTRTKTPHGTGPFYQHLGIYAYRREALKRFTQLSPSVLEQRESLEQLRALEARMRIDVKIVQSNAMSVDTTNDLEKVRTLIPHDHHKGLYKKIFNDKILKS
ncbi:3-deoxy-manno-octulosonate cytidylyltransferase [Candidatus Liberibacter asiaticus]|uniref:3-deoxy-manno-octulosonate cytidylyltransferase n=2 Tax=Liberibacter asiaticus TaxID=34021 RepID=C6XFT5_LIBAP|nr:3-deoxy-manno-octulosonate cytidylyltransferase [Candidatus Liberibacter asiaticus]ACT57238.1 3-deoxy-manno-octulosonate cytidylyltransferase [Candidatus Liberibacter asiaticus str. psy62]AGH16799.1 3-deoxy-manno-octulosonate cytidylyltransferase [Candidatus Liberibacter asiaticus str. gxpsy]ASK52640.1 3-deoxy-manno-octulosonate cytidylyltransferase [Candidatus Liberibacter asiaticus]AWL13965.1 3-deoxy-manno-octulosonate cytidylyltransferase [Candidatus Liberibacter asiaticus]KAE9510245.1 3